MLFCCVLVLFSSFLSFLFWWKTSCFSSCWVASLFFVLSAFALFFVLPVASPPGGHDLVAYPSCLRLGVLFLPLCGLPLLFVSPLEVFVFILFYFIVFLPFSGFLSLSFVFLSFLGYVRVTGVRMLCLLYPVRCSGLHCLLALLHYYEPVSLCRSSVTTELVPGISLG